MGWINSIFGKNKNRPPYHLGEIGVDMHSHLIPGIDDGSQSMDQTIGMLLKFVELGYKKVITTPHIMTDQYKNTPPIILEGLEAVKKEVKKLGIPIEIEAAAEYYYDEFLLEKVRNKELLTFGDNYILFEFSFSSPPAAYDELIFEFSAQGYTPILAHYERYAYFIPKGMELVEKFRNNGVKIQLNLGSLFGNYGPQIKKQAEQLIDNRLIDFVGTDCHRMDHLKILEDNLSNPYLHKLSGLNLLNRKL